MCHLPHNWNCCPISQPCCGPGCCAEGTHCVDLVFGKCCPDGKRLCGAGACVSGECCGKGGCEKGRRCCGGKCCREGEVCDYGERCVRIGGEVEGCAARMGRMRVVGVVVWLWVVVRMVG
ncbi:hypothetical protein CPLU01_07249 [Colletotrichum plurivorum]|uniref:Uncharacterized protein n=1 Tax=Colletotrichum plurivorum TaxID=2175906 RepID=A0A8H6KFD8_9PEZI|nr:hypothetical protein CPLU01_07249 [Colletotrichum plurivorum]